MSVQAVNSVNNIQQKAVQSTIESQKPEPKEGISDGTKLLLGSLAALAIGGGIYLATRGKGKVKSQTQVDEVKNPTNNTQLEELQKQVKELKNKIKTDYLSKKQFSMEEWKKSEDSKVCLFQMAIIKKDRIETTKECNKILDRLLTEQMETGLSFNKNKKIVDDFSKMIKDKVRELSSDKDWIELRNWRRNLVKMSKDKVQRKNITNDDKARKQLIDEILLSKINGKPTEKLEMLDLSVEDAIKMVKSDNTEQILMDLQVKKYGGYNYPELGFIGTNKLRIKYLFENKGYCKYVTAKEQVNKWQYLVDLVKKQKSMIQERLANVAQEVRQSDDVKALKELNRQIAELSKLEQNK